MDDLMLIRSGSDPAQYITLQSKNLTTVKDIAKIHSKDPMERAENYEALKKTDKIFDLHNYIEHGHLIYFEYQQKNERHSVLYNSKKRTAQNFGATKNDLMYRDFNPDKYSYFGFFDQQGAYEIPDPDWLSRLQDNIRNNRFVPDLDKLDKLKQLTETSNPPIFYYEFKETSN